MEGRKKKFYLAHSSLSRKEVREWQLGIEKDLPIEFINPFYDLDREETALLKKVDEGEMTREEYIDSLVPNEVVERDCEAIKQADGLLAIFDDNPTYGTIMEVMGGWINTDNPVYLIVTNGHHKNPWLRHFSNHIFTSKQDFIEHICVSGQ